MSQLRSAKKKKPKKGRCRWCEGDVHRLSDRRRTFCSDECVHEYRLRSSPSYMRQQVRKRDRCICSLCHLNCLALAKELRQLAKQNLDHLEADVFKSRGLEPIKFIGTQKRSLWAADHIVPVVEGGGECGLENMRTLCIWCHKKVTAELKIRLGQKKI